MLSDTHHCHHTYDASILIRPIFAGLNTHNAEGVCQALGQDTMTCDEFSRNINLYFQHQIYCIVILNLANKCFACEVCLCIFFTINYTRVAQLSFSLYLIVSLINLSVCILLETLIHIHVDRTDQNCSDFSPAGPEQQQKIKQNE